METSSVLPNQLRETELLERVALSCDHNQMCNYSHTIQIDARVDRYPISSY